MRVLKERIGAAIGMSPEEFRIYRKSGSGAAEYKRELIKLEVNREERESCMANGLSLD